MELQISHSVCAEVQKESALQRKKTRGGRNPKDTLRMEKDKNSRGRSVPGPCTYAGGNTAKSIGVQLHGIFERQKQSDDL